MKRLVVVGAISLGPALASPAALTGRWISVPSDSTLSQAIAGPMNAVVSSINIVCEPHGGNPGPPEPAGAHGPMQLSQLAQIRQVQEFRTAMHKTAGRIAGSWPGPGAFSFHEMAGIHLSTSKYSTPTTL